MGDAEGLGWRERRKDWEVFQTGVHHVKFLNIQSRILSKKEEVEIKQDAYEKKKRPQRNN